MRKDFFGAVVVALTCLLPATSGSQQSVQSPDWRKVLALPVGTTFVCTLADSALTSGMPPQIIWRTFRVGEPWMELETTWPREITVAFDSTGKTIMLTDETRARTTKGYPAGDEMVIAVLAKDSVVAHRMETVVDTAALSAALDARDLEKSLTAAKPGVSRALGGDEVVQLRALGEFLWKRRCFRDGK